MRAADLPGRLPQASSGRPSAAPQLLPSDCPHAITPFPRKSHRLPFKTVRGCLPQSFRSPQSPGMTRFTLIYPFVLFGLLAMSVPFYYQGIHLIPSADSLAKRSADLMKHPLLAVWTYIFRTWLLGQRTIITRQMPFSVS
jgi:hypothetical protein